MLSTVDIPGNERKHRAHHESGIRYSGSTRSDKVSDFRRKPYTRASRILYSGTTTSCIRVFYSTLIKAGHDLYLIYLWCLLFFKVLPIRSINLKSCTFPIFDCFFSSSGCTNFQPLFTNPQIFLLKSFSFSLVNCISCRFPSLLAMQSKPLLFSANLVSDTGEQSL